MIESIIIKKTDLEKIWPLIQRYEFKDYNKYRVFKKEHLDKYLFEQIQKQLIKANTGWIIAAVGNKNIIGLVSVNRLEWGKEIFGFEMAELKHIIIDDSVERNDEIVNVLLNFIFKLCNKNNISHISCRINTEDFYLIKNLQKNGFMITDTLVTYLCDKRKIKPPTFKSLYIVRSFKNSDLENLINMVKDAFPFSRFYADPYIPKNRVNDFYIRWVKGCADGRLADKILVTDKMGEAIGFAAYRLNKDLKKVSGYRVIGQGLSAVSLRHRGVYPSLMAATIRDVKKLYDFAEFDTQVDNYEVINIWQKFGFMFVRSKYSFSKWIKR